MSPDNTDEKQRGRPFEKGTSGNPSGRPRGSRNATTLALEVLLDGQAAVAAGEMTPADAAELGKLIDSYVKAYETAELTERLERLEGMTGQ